MKASVIMSYEMVSPAVLASVVEKEIGVLCNWREVQNGEGFRLWIMGDYTDKQALQMVSISKRFATKK